MGMNRETYRSAMAALSFGLSSYVSMLWLPHDISYNTPRRNRGAHHQPIGQRLCVAPQLRTNMSGMGTAQSLPPPTCHSNDNKVIMGRPRRLLPGKPKQAALGTIPSHSTYVDAVYVAPWDISLILVQDAPQSSSLGNTRTGRRREGSAEGILPSDHAHPASLLPYHRVTRFVHTVPVVDRLRPTPLIHPPPACTGMHGNTIRQSEGHLIDDGLAPSTPTLASVDPAGEQVQTRREGGSNESAADLPGEGGGWRRLALSFGAYPIVSP